MAHAEGTTIIHCQFYLYFLIKYHVFDLSKIVYEYLYYILFIYSIFNDYNNQVRNYEKGLIPSFATLRLLRPTF